MGPPQQPYIARAGQVNRPTRATGRRAGGSWRRRFGLAYFFWLAGRTDVAPVVAGAAGSGGVGATLAAT